MTSQNGVQDLPLSDSTASVEAQPAPVEVILSTGAGWASTDAVESDSGRSWTPFWLVIYPRRPALRTIGVTVRIRWSAGFSQTGAPNHRRNRSHKMVGWVLALTIRHQEGISNDRSRRSRSGRNT